MPSNDPKNNVAEHPTLSRRHSKVTEFEVYRLLENFRQHPTRPVSICLNGMSFSWIKDKGPNDQTSAGNLLSKEIQLWSDAIGHRIVESLLFCFPFQFMQPYELTEIMHVLASRFSLSESHTRCHRVATKLDEINSDHIALLKGLGFNQYQIIVSREDLENLAALDDAMQLIRQYSYSGIGIQIHDADCLDDLRDNVIDLKSKLRPDYIYIGYRPKLLDNNMEYGAIIFDGENEMEQNRIYMGLEGTSNLQSLVLQNYCNPERYISALKSDKLPINPGPLSV